MKVVRCLLLFCIYSHKVLVQKSKKGSIGFFKLGKKTRANYRFESLETISFCSEIYYVDNEGTK